MLKHVFRFPQWNQRKGCCHKCRATPETVKDPTSTADWRSNELSTVDLILRMLEWGLDLPTIFGAPGFETEIFVEDWLHTADLGVSQDVIGNLFWLLLSKMTGPNQEERCKELYRQIDSWYKLQDNLPGKLDHLTIKIRKKKSASTPKLKAYGAEVRGLIGFAKFAAHEWLDKTNPFEQTVVLAVDELASCYSCLSHNQIFARDRLCVHSQRLCTFLRALEDKAPHPLWKVKPKAHRFQHMCETCHNHPRECWTYRDEDFGGTLSKLARSAGGKTSPVAIGLRVLHKFCANNKLPALS